MQTVIAAFALLQRLNSGVIPDRFGLEAVEGRTLKLCSATSAYPNILRYAVFGVTYIDHELDK